MNFISKKLLEVLVKENVINDSVVLNKDTNDIEYKTAVNVDGNIEIVPRHKNVFDLAFNECFALIESKGYDLLIMDTERFYFSNYGDPMKQPRFDAGKGKYALCESAFKACEWFIENVNGR